MHDFMYLVAPSSGFLYSQLIGLQMTSLSLNGVLYWLAGTGFLNHSRTSWLDTKKTSPNSMALSINKPKPSKLFALCSNQYESKRKDNGARLPDLTRCNSPNNQSAISSGVPLKNSALLTWSERGEPTGEPELSNLLVIACCQRIAFSTVIPLDIGNGGDPKSFVFFCNALIGNGAFLCRQIIESVGQYWVGTHRRPWTVVT